MYQEIEAKITAAFGSERYKYIYHIISTANHFLGFLVYMISDADTFSCNIGLACKYYVNIALLFGLFLLLLFLFFLVGLRTPFSLIFMILVVVFI